MHPLRPRHALGLITSILLLRCAERLLASLDAPSHLVRTEMSLHTPLVSTRPLSVGAQVIVPAAVPSPPPSPMVTAPLRASRGKVSVQASFLDQAVVAHRSLHTRPLDFEEASLLWRAPIGEWLATHIGRTVARSSPAPTRLRSCSPGCGMHGRCDAALGVCQCSSGWAGERCERPQRWPCNPHDGRYMWSRCAGECDTRYGYCYCGERGAYPHRPLLQCEPIGIEDLISPWRVDGRNHAERKPWSSIWGRSSGGKPGWCDANASIGEQPAARCACRYDGWDGYLCQHRVAMFCPNQCNGRGTCEHGFCLCADGWWGVDCSISNEGGLSHREPAQLFSALDGAARAEAAAAIHGAAAESPPPRVRPLIYVYEMPQRFTTDLLQRRHDKLFCSHRTYLKANSTQYAYGIYQGYVLEVMLHEWLLSSAHRTSDPSEADWFYVPVYAT